MFCAELVIKLEENAMFENAQSEVPVRGVVGGAHYLTRLATQGRGGFKWLRAFRRARLKDNKFLLKYDKSPSQILVNYCHVVAC